MKRVKRSFEDELERRLKEKPQFIQCIIGPRQVGKTTGVIAVLKKLYSAEEYFYASCEGENSTAGWLQNIVQSAIQRKVKVITVDEIQLVENWSESIKIIWDQLKLKKSSPHLVILGSSSLQLSQGLDESLAGRFELIQVPHWGVRESSSLVKMNLDNYLANGGYPGSYSLLKDEKRFRKYMIESIFEAVVTKDILRFAHVKKPALFRQTYVLASQFPAQVVSYNKFLGQLVEAGNVDQIKYYLDLFEKAFLCRLIFKYSISPKSKTSSPKILPSAPVLTTIFSNSGSSDELRGRIFEAVVGNRLCEAFDKVFYWSEGNYEVDFVVQAKGVIIGIEVKSKRRKTSSLSFFRKRVPSVKTCFIDMENFLEFEKSPIEFLENYSM